MSKKLSELYDLIPISTSVTTKQIIKPQSPDHNLSDSSFLFSITHTLPMNDQINTLL